MVSLPQNPENFNSYTGLQIRGGKGYFSIDFLEFSIENLIKEWKYPLQFEVSVLIFNLCGEFFLLLVRKK